MKSYVSGRREGGNKLTRREGSTSITERDEDDLGRQHGGEDDVVLDPFPASCGTLINETWSPLLGWDAANTKRDVDSRNEQTEGATSHDEFANRPSARPAFAPSLFPFHVAASEKCSQFKWQRRNARNSACNQRKHVRQLRHQLLNLVRGTHLRDLPVARKKHQNNVVGWVNGSAISPVRNFDFLSLTFAVQPPKLL
jgi:hypothetical protein